MEVVIAVDDPRVDDVRALLEAHLAFSRAVTPPGHVHALEIDGLLDPAVTFFSARRDGVLVGIGALKRLDDSHAENDGASANAFMIPVEGIAIAGGSSTRVELTCQILDNFAVILPSRIMLTHVKEVTS